MTKHTVNTDDHRVLQRKHMTKLIKNVEAETTPRRPPYRKKDGKFSRKASRKEKFSYDEHILSPPYPLEQDNLEPICTTDADLITASPPK